MNQEGKFESSYVMDRLTIMEQLISTLESEVPGEDNPSSHQDCISQYHSMIKFDGVPILPPVMTKNRREEMQVYKHQAMMKEVKIKSSSHKKLLDTVQQVIERLKKKKDVSVDIENSQEGKDEPKKVPPDKELDKNVSPNKDYNMPDCFKIPDGKLISSHVPLDTNFPEATASPRSAVGDSGISSDIQQMTSPRTAQTSTLETLDTLAEITDMSTDFESDLVTGPGVSDTEVRKRDDKEPDDAVSLSETGTLVDQTGADPITDIAMKKSHSSTEGDAFSEAPVAVEGRFFDNDLPPSLCDEESETNEKDNNQDHAMEKDAGPTTKNSDSSQASSDTISVTVISRDDKDARVANVLVKEGSNAAESDSEDNGDLNDEEPKMDEIDASSVTTRSSQYSQTEGSVDHVSLSDSLEYSDERVESQDEKNEHQVEKDIHPAQDVTEDADNVTPIKDSLELGSTLLSRVALSDNEDSGDSTLESQSGIGHGADSDINKTENVTNITTGVAVERQHDNPNGQGVEEAQDEEDTLEDQKKTENAAEDDHRMETKQTHAKPELFSGQTQKLMVLQKLNTLLEQVESKTSAMKPKSILRTPEKYGVTPAEVVSPGPDHTPDVSVISYADSCVSTRHVQQRTEETPIKSSSVVPKPATSPHPKSGESPPSANKEGGEPKSMDTSIVHTASTELSRYMADSAASMDTINSVSTLPHTGATSVKDIRETTEHVPARKATPAAPESSEQKDLNSTTKSHKRQGSYTLEKPSPALLQSSKLDSKSEKGATADPGCTSSAEDLKLRPVHRKLQYDKENTPPRFESDMNERSAKEEHLHRYLQQLGQMPQSHPPQLPPSVTPPTVPMQPVEADLLHDQIKYFEQMKDHMMLLHQQRLSQLIGEQQRQQLFLQQQFLQQEHQLRQQMSVTLGKGRDSQLSQSTLTPDVPALSMTLPIFGMVPSMPADMAASMTSFSHPGVPNPFSNSFTSPINQAFPSNTSLYNVAPDLANQFIQSAAKDQPSQPTNNSPRVCFSTDTTTTPAQVNSPGVQVHYYTPEHSSPPSPEVTTVVRRPVSAPLSTSLGHRKSASQSRMTPEISRRAVKIHLECLSDDVLHKFNRVTAAVRGYLTRRLLKTQKVQQIITTIRDTAIFALNFQSETPIKQGVYSSQDKRLQDRVLAQLTAAMYEINEIFVQVPIKERLAIIAHDRELLRENFFKEQKHSAEKKVSAATRKAMERKKRARLAEKSMLEQSFRSKSAPPSARSPRSSQAKPEDISGPIKRNYQFMISRAMPKSARSRRSGNSPLKPVKDNINRSVLENGKTKKENIPTLKTNTNTKRTNAKQDTIVRKTVTLASKKPANNQNFENKISAGKLHQDKNTSIASRLNNAAMKPKQESEVLDVVPHSTQKSKANSTTPWK